MADDDDECPDLVTAKVPVTILTGFLGSGKTTLLQYVLTEQHQLKIAVIVNEFDFGKSIEKGLTVKSTTKADDEWVELNNGCMCCTAKNQSVIALEKLMARKGTFDLVLVETSGLADPAPICTMFWQDEALHGSLFLCGVVTVVDAKNIVQYLHGDKFPEALQQLLIADKIVLNKIDMVDDDGKAKAKEAVKNVNPVAAIEETQFSKVVDLKKLLFINTTHSYGELETQSPSGIAKAEHVHSGIGSVAIEIPLVVTPNSGGTQVLALPSIRDIDFLCKALLYHEGKEKFSIVRSKAAVWVKTNDPALMVASPPTSGTQTVEKKKEGVMLVQLQTIGDTFDIHPMQGVTVPFGVSRYLILGKEMNHDRLETIIREFCCLVSV